MCEWLSIFWFIFVRWYLQNFKCATSVAVHTHTHYSSGWASCWSCIIGLNIRLFCCGNTSQRVLRETTTLGVPWHPFLSKWVWFVDPHLLLCHWRWPLTSRKASQTFFGTANDRPIHNRSLVGTLPVFNVVKIALRTHCISTEHPLRRSISTTVREGQDGDFHKNTTNWVDPFVRQSILPSFALTEHAIDFKSKHFFNFFTIATADKDES